MHLPYYLPGKCPAQFIYKSNFVCNGRCMPDSLKDKVYPCDNYCIHFENACNNRNCSSKLPVKCGSRCLPAKTPCVCSKNEIKCGEDCVYKSLPCQGKCPEEYPKKCGNRCIKENSTNYECKGKCISAKMPCEGKCLDPKAHACEGFCVTEKEYLEDYQECDGTCVYISKPCKGKCHEKMPQMCPKYKACTSGKLPCDQEFIVG